MRRYLPFRGLLRSPSAARLGNAETPAFPRSRASRSVPETTNREPAVLVVAVQVRIVVVVVQVHEVREDAIDFRRTPEVRVVAVVVEVAEAVVASRQRLKTEGIVAVSVIVPAVPATLALQLCTRRGTAANLRE